MDKEMLIRDMYAREILDSKGNPAIEIEVLAGEDTVGRAAVSSGKTADRRGTEKKAGDRRRDKQMAEQAVETVNSTLAHTIIGMNVFDQEAVDQALIRTEGGGRKPGEENTGTDILRGVSTAVSRAAARALQIPLFRYLGGVRAKRMPVPAMILTGSGISGDDSTDIKELMIIPAKSGDFQGMLSVCTEVYHAMEAALAENASLGKSENPETSEIHMTDVRGAEEAARMVQKAVERAGHCFGRDVEIGLNTGAPGLYDRRRKVYIFPGESRQYGHEIIRTGKELVSYYEKLTSEFPICFIEEPLACEDSEAWSELCCREWGCGMDSVQIAAGVHACAGTFMEGEPGIRTDFDEIYQRGQRGAGAVSVLRADMNRSSTMTEMFHTIDAARRAGMRVMISQPSGGVEETAAADIAVACGAEWIKCGAPGRQESAAVYNRLLKIEEELR